MKDMIGPTKRKLELKWRTLSTTLLAVVFFVGCIAAIPIAVHYYKGHNNYVATADISKSADEVWAAVVGLGEKRKAEGRIEIMERDDTKRMIKVTDGVQITEVKVIADGQSKSKIIVTADVPKGEEKEREKEKELAARIMKNLWEEAKAECKLVEG